MQETYVKMFAFAENHTKKNWYSLLSVCCSSGIGLILFIIHGVMVSSFAQN